MSFIRALSSGVSGLKNHQLMLDVIGNNIANINTVAFKGSRVSFSEMFSQTLSGATRPYGQNGGVNPRQVGLGSGVASIDVSFSQGNIESTGNSTDMAIQGDGFFILQKDGQQFYSRAGTFALDSNGTLVHPGTGAILQGRLPDAQGLLQEGTRLENLVIGLDRSAPPQSTTLVRYAGNLNAAALVGDTVSGTVNVFDSLGNTHALTLEFTKTSDNNWDWEVLRPDPANPGSFLSVNTGTITFDGDGLITAVDGVALTPLQIANNDPINLPVTFTPPGGANNITLDIQIGRAGEFSGITQSEGISNITPREQNGYGVGMLTDISIDQSGRVLGTFSNGAIMTLAQVMLAEFTNPSGLMRRGDNLYEVSSNSGYPAVVNPDSSASAILSGALEMSNVDLAAEFTRMIVAQRGFQSNARIITVSDDILNEVVNLKR